MDSYKLDFTNIGKTKIMLKELKTLKIIYFVTLLLLIPNLAIFYFNITSKINKNKTKIEELEKDKIQLKNEITYLKKENSKLDKNSISLENQYKDISNKLNIYIPYLNKIKQNTDLIDKSKSFNETSSIINNEYKKQNLIINWIKNKVQKSVINFELIFKMSIQGYTSYDFHKYCDDAGPTLILIKTTKDKIFGGFTPLNWKEENEKGIKFDKNDETFIFSLNLMKKFDMIDYRGKEAIKCWNKMGPVFSNDFGLFENLKKGESYANSYSNFLTNNNLELTGGKGKTKEFETKELEIYKVIY